MTTPPNDSAQSVARTSETIASAFPSFTRMATILEELRKALAGEVKDGD